MTGDGAVRWRGEDLPAEQRTALRKAIRIEWFSIGYLILAVSTIMMVAGQSQAMAVAWAEDALSLLPPIAFLIAVRLTRMVRTPEFPYGLHRAVAIGQLVAAVTLLAMGAFLLVDSALGLVEGERVPIGLTVILGQEIWAGWPMVVVVGFWGIPPAVLARYKIRYARILHNKALYADAAMSKADWMTSVSTVVGVLGVGVGLWWADPVAAIVVAASIVSDGTRNLWSALRGLSDSRVRTYDDSAPHPLITEILRRARDEEWVHDAGVRVRDQGQVFHAEVYVVPRTGMDPTAVQLAALREGLRDIDWKVHDVVVASVPDIPERQVPAHR